MKIWKKKNKARITFQQFFKKRGTISKEIISQKFAVESAYNMLTVTLVIKNLKYTDDIEK